MPFSGMIWSFVIKAKLRGLCCNYTKIIPITSGLDVHFIPIPNIVPF